MVPAVEWQDCIVRIDMVVAVMDSPDYADGWVNLIRVLHLLVWWVKDGNR